MYILSVILNPSIFHFGTKNLSKKSEMIGYDTYIITYEICNVSFMKKKGKYRKYTPHMVFLWWDPTWIPPHFVLEMTVIMTTFRQL